jgi:rhodanese-related sulfurtransferase
VNVSPNEWGDVRVGSFAIQTAASQSYGGCSPVGQTTIQALPVTGYKFDHWGGALSGSSNPAAIVVDASKTVTAYFTLASQGIVLSEAVNKINSNKNLFVLDIRSATDFNNGHMLCARNYPWNGTSFSGGIASLNPYKEYDILVYDQSGTACDNAADYLAGQGFKSVYYMTDGLNDWVAEGYETYMTAEDGGICTSIPPLAYAGPDKTVNENVSVTLNGQGPAGAAYSWTQTKGANVDWTSSQNIAQPTFTAPDLTDGNDELEFLLTVTSGGLEDSDSVIVNVTWINQAPIANAGPDQTIKSGAAVTLDGSKSSDPEDSTSLKYSWSVSAASGVKPPSLSNSSDKKATFTAPSGTGWIKFRLTVTDNGGKIDDDEVLITISGSNGGTTPEAPTGLAANAVSNKKIMLRWMDNSDNEDGFKIERKKGGCNSSNEYIQLAIVPGDNKYEDGNVEAATQYSYRVRAYKGSNNSAYTANCSTTTTSASGTPNAPVRLVATYVDSSKIDLSWDEWSANVKKFEIYRQVNNTGSWALIATTGPEIHNYRDAKATNNQTTTFYRYKVHACNDAGCSPPTYSVGVPFKPTNLNASVDSKGKVMLAWTDNSNDNSGFEIYRKEGTCNSSSSWALLKSAGKDSEKISGGSVESGKRYSYKIRAYCRSWGLPYVYGYSGWSDCVTVTVP